MLAAAGGDQHAADQRAGEGGKHQRQEHQLPAEKRADHRQQLHVAHAKPFLPSAAVVRLGDRQQESAADDEADQRADPARAAGRSCRRSPTTMPGSVMTLGRILCWRSVTNSTISAQREDDAHRHQERQAVRQIGDDKDQRGHDLDRGIHPRHRLLAGAAPAAEHDPAEDGKIVEPGQHAPARRAARARMHDRLTAAAVDRRRRSGSCRCTDRTA